MNTAKKKYESLLILHNRLCNVLNEVDYLKIIDLLKEDIQLVKQYHLFPIELSDKFYDCLNGIVESLETDKLFLAKELYVYLARLMFRFEEVNIYSMEPYQRILELGRTVFPYEEAMTWGEEFKEERHFSHELFYFQFNAQYLYRLTVLEYEDYYQKLRTPHVDIQNILPPDEEYIPTEFLSTVQEELQEQYQNYNRYIDENYFTIKHFFSYYKKKCSLYIHQRNESFYIAMMNIYESVYSETNVCPHWVDIMYRFHNVESFTTKISNGILFGIDPTTKVDFSSIFSQQNIHNELNGIFVKYASIENIRNYFCYMQRGQLKRVLVQSSNPYEIIVGNEKYLLNIQDIPTASILEKKLPEYRSLYNGIIFRFRPDKEIYSMLHDANLSVISVEDMGYNLVQIGNGEMIHLFIRERLSDLQIDNSLIDVPLGEVLIEKLNRCPKGHAGWSLYEDIGSEIFTYLFKDCFRNYKLEYQSKTIDNVFRRDLLVNNTYNTEPSFWKMVEYDYGSKIIIVDFKNYHNPLNTDEFHNISKYFNKIIGNFAIVFSRDGLSDSAQKYQLQMLEEGRLIICLSDKDIIDMIRLKSRGQNPLDSLENIYYSLCKKR